MQFAKNPLLGLATLIFVTSGCASVKRAAEFKLPFMRDKQATVEQPPTLSSTGQLIAGQQSEVQKASAEAPWAQDIQEPTRNNQALAVATELADTITGKTDATKGQRLFQEAERIFASASTAQGDARVQGFENAADRYRSAASAFPSSPSQENAQFMIAESYFFSDQYTKSKAQYDALVKNYPNTRHMDTVSERRFAIAKYWLDTHERDDDFIPNIGDRRRPAVNALGQSVSLFDKIRFDDPTGQLADDATMAAAIANVNARRFPEADILLEDIRENFPNSTHQFRAHLLSLECKQRVYRGPDYDGTALDDAEKLIKQMHIRFPQETTQNQEYVQKSLREVRLKKAEHFFEEARYYDRRKEYEAARIAYERVARDFSDTSLAVEAESRLAKIDGKPANPKNQLKWLADVFPKENTRPRPLLARDDAGIKVR